MADPLLWGRVGSHSLHTDSQSWTTSCAEVASWVRFQQEKNEQQFIPPPTPPQLREKLLV